MDGFSPMDRHLRSCRRRLGAVSAGVLFALALLPATLAPVYLGILGGAYLVISLVLGVGFLSMVIWSLLGGGPTRQRWVFLSSLLYLMGLLAFMLIDRQPPAV